MGLIDDHVRGWPGGGGLQLGKLVVVPGSGAARGVQRGLRAAATEV